MAEPFAVDSPLVLIQRRNLVVDEPEDEAAARKALMLAAQLLIK